jgi:type IV secretory pathway VirB9-like protein
VKATSFTPANKKAPMATAKYTIKNTKYYSIVAKKDKHIADILIQKAGKDVILMVISK